MVGFGEFYLGFCIDREWVFYLSVLGCGIVAGADILFCRGASSLALRAKCGENVPQVLKAGGGEGFPSIIRWVASIVA